MDGVIVNSNPMHTEAWSRFNRRYGIETTDAMIQRMYGRRNDEIVRDYFGGDLSDEFEGNGQGGGMAENDVGSGIADQEGVHAGLGHQTGGGVIVAGEHGDLGTALAGGAEVVEGELAWDNLGHLRIVSCLYASFPFPAAIGVSYYCPGECRRIISSTRA